LSTDARLGYASRLQTPYIDTTDQCLELYFQAQSTSPLSKPEISIIAVDEEQQETELASTMGLERTNWDRLFTRLPAGVHRVVVQGLRSLSGYSGMSVDDIVVQPCDKFGNRFILDVACACFTGRAVSADPRCIVSVFIV